MFVARPIIRQADYLWNAVGQRQTAQRKLLVDENGDRQIAAEFGVNPLAPDGVAIDAIAPEHLIELVHTADQLPVLKETCSCHNDSFFGLCLNQLRAWSARLAGDCFRSREILKFSPVQRHNRQAGAAARLANG